MDMMPENTTTEYKRLKKITSGDAGLKDLAVTCVALANTQGGNIVIGIEDQDKTPPIDQVITDELINKAVTRLRGLTFNVGVVPARKEKHPSGGEYFSIVIQPTLRSLATTSDGKIYVRVGDQCLPARGEDILRLATEKDAFQWELQPRSYTLFGIPSAAVTAFVDEIRASDRVKSSIKEKTEEEILEHYNMVLRDNRLTNLGVLWLGTTAMRSRLAYPITVQYIVYDELEKKSKMKNGWITRLAPSNYCWI